MEFGTQVPILLTNLLLSSPRMLNCDDTRMSNIRRNINDYFKIPKAKQSHPYTNQMWDWGCYIPRTVPPMIIAAATSVRPGLGTPGSARNSPRHPRFCDMMIT
jgi:hypothetical protein